MRPSFSDRLLDQAIVPPWSIRRERAEDHRLTVAIGQPVGAAPLFAGRALKTPQFDAAQAKADGLCCRFAITELVSSTRWSASSHKALATGPIAEVGKIGPIQIRHQLGQAVAHDSRRPMLAQITQIAFENGLRCRRTVKHEMHP